MNESNTQVVLEVAKAVGAHLELSDVLAALVATLNPVVHFDAVSVAILEDGTTRGYSVHVEDFPRRAGESHESFVARYAPELEDPPQFSVDEHAVGEIMKSGKSGKIILDWSAYRSLTP